MTNYLLDTTVIIDYLRGRPEVVGLIKRLFAEGSSLGCCPINIIEVYAGMRKKEREGTDLSPPSRGRARERGSKGPLMTGPLIFTLCGADDNIASPLLQAQGRNDTRLFNVHRLTCYSNSQFT